MRYAIIENAQVTNIIDYETPPPNPPPGLPETAMAVQSDNAQIGWLYEQGQFIEPPAPPTPKIPSDELRRIAYQTESDPIFFMAQRGEATIEEWQAKIQEIKNRYPKD
jgi:hypothetical protein